jgi:hypothetical protein
MYLELLFKNFHGINRRTHFFNNLKEMKITKTFIGAVSQLVDISSSLKRKLTVLYFCSRCSGAIFSLLVFLLLIRTLVIKLCLDLKIGTAIRSGSVFFSSPGVFDIY